MMEIFKAPEYVGNGESFYRDIEKVYSEKSKEYQEKCSVLAKLGEDFERDVNLCVEKLQHLYDESNPGFFKKLYFRIKSFSSKNENVLENLIKAEVKTLGEIKNKLGEKIKYAKQEVSIANQRINELYDMEIKLLERLEDNKKELQQLEREIERINKELNSENYIDESDLKVVKEKLQLEQQKRMKEVKKNTYKGELLAGETLQKQIRNLRKAYKILIDEGLVLVIENAETVYSHLKGTYDALEKMIGGKIAVAGLTEITAKAVKMFTQVRKDMNYVFGMITNLAAKLPDVLPLLEEPFYDEKMLEYSSKILKEGDEKFNNQLKKLTRDVIDVKVLPYNDK